MIQQEKGVRYMEGTFEVNAFIKSTTEGPVANKLLSPITPDASEKITTCEMPLILIPFGTAGK